MVEEAIAVSSRKFCKGVTFILSLEALRDMWYRDIVPEENRATSGGFAVDVIVQGIVQGGCVVPDSPLPEGARVEVRIVGSPAEVPPELQAEFDAWGRASDRALNLIDGSVSEGGDAAG